MFENTFWSLMPAVVAILLALITKEVYSSLFLGVVLGGLLYANFSFIGTINHVFNDGIVASISDSYNVGILVFDVFLGALIILMNRAGGSAAFGRWAKAHVKTKVGAQLATIALGVLIFIDDYFNCLTVGAVMRPLTDEHKISRAKLAYLIDATAAPVCIIAPISSWAAAVTGFVEGANGFELFLKAIPYNFYAILTIVMMLTLAFRNFDYGPMKVAEMSNHLNKTDDEISEEKNVNMNGKVIHLVLPVLVLIAASIVGMIYTGGFFDGENLVTAFSNADASVGLMYGSAFALVFTIIFFMATKVLNFKDCMDCIPEGFKAMVPAIMILILAWSLKGMTDSLGAKTYVAGLVENIAQNHALMSLLPAFVFVIGCFLAFATGTSWGTFGILIPIIVAVFGGDMSNELMIIGISACMAGAVCGDHCSPISDTTIMASAGAGDNHIEHVSTQLPYALTVAFISMITYVVAGFCRAWYIALPFGIILMIASLLFIQKITSAEK